MVTTSALHVLITVKFCLLSFSFKARTLKKWNSMYFKINDGISEKIVMLRFH